MVSFSRLFVALKLFYDKKGRCEIKYQHDGEYLRILLVSNFVSYFGFFVWTDVHFRFRGIFIFYFNISSFHHSCYVCHQQFKTKLLVHDRVGSAFRIVSFTLKAQIQQYTFAPMGWQFQHYLKVPLKIRISNINHIVHIVCDLSGWSLENCVNQTFTIPISQMLRTN